MCIKSKYGNCQGSERFSDGTGYEYCVFHLPSEARKKLNLTDRFNAVITTINTILDNDVDFSGCEFDELNILPGITNSEYKATFIDCRFKILLSLRKREIRACDFSKSFFEKGVDFEESTFRGEVNFKETKIAGLANFKKCTFLKHADFRLEGVYADFSECSFQSDSYFSFDEADQKEKPEGFFAADLNFLEIVIESKCEVLISGILKNCAFSPRGNGVLKFDRCELKNASFMHANLEKCVFISVNLNESLFLGAEISKTQFFDCSFRETKYLFGNRRILLFDEEYISSRKIYRDRGYRTWFNFLSERQRNFPNALKETYCSFKNNYEANKDYVMADGFHFSEMEFKRMLRPDVSLESAGDKERVPTKLFYFSYWIRSDVFSFYAWYKYFSGYGTSYLRSLVWILLSLVLFACSYLFTGLPGIHYQVGRPSDVLIVTKDFVDSFFYAVGILIPGGAKYYFPEELPSLTKKLFIIEFIVLWTLIPLFILALKRHFKR